MSTQTLAQDLRAGQTVTFRGQRYTLTADATTAGRVATLEVTNVRTGEATALMPSARTRFAAR